ncbi:hypothetical protein SMKI_03G1190 [Saccharomyces mikatae IFO 1815]|uniref:Guanine nucleotide-exchange factor SEC12 n=1 Tax=Saccharomyces mikatae IFO 1815 TaxID=226126 RepID=A0AA35IXE8_SACMI|nr:uncharacterized protein SMKI_03G1190 [Saccharomyces mikatae IFO 1815]CAI4037641.1 hypothetical protein SMKI_03G1190 [Saccharomyces mikatae IFO 1815]
MSGDSANYDVGYPIYGAKFINEDTLLVAGGGGKFNSSFPNKITALKVNFQKKKRIRRFREITLDSMDDAPTSLDCNNNLILVGCNELFNESSVENVNHHLRKFMFEQEHLKFVASIDFNRTTDPSVFTKFVYIDQRATVAAIASSAVPSVIRIIDPRNLTENYEIETGKEVNDLHFAPNGILLSYITSNSLEVASVRDGKFVARKTDFDKNLILSKIRFINDDTLLVAASLSNSDGVSLLKIGVSSRGVKILKTAPFMFDLNVITSMDVSPNGQFIGISSNDNSIAIINVGKLELVQLVPRVHESNITRVTFSPNSKYLASTSMGNTINVLKLSITSSSILRKIWNFFVNFVLLVVLAGAVQLGYKHDLHGLLYRHAHDIYNSKFKGNTFVDQGSSYCSTVSDDYRGITETADIVSANDLTRDISTELSLFDTSTMKTIVEDLTSSVWISPSSISEVPSLDSPTEIPCSFSSKTSDFVTSDLPMSSLSFTERATSEQILSSSTSELAKPITSSAISTIAETNITPLNAESITSPLEPITEYPESILYSSEQASPLVVVQSDNQRVTSTDGESKMVISEMTSPSPLLTHSLSHTPSSLLSLSAISTAAASSALSTDLVTIITTTRTNPTNGPAELSSIDNLKIAPTREVYKTKIITEVITKIEYRNMPVSSYEATTGQHIEALSSWSLTPTNTMISRSLTEIEPMASELQSMVETPADLTSRESIIDQIKSNLTSYENSSLISASRDSTTFHRKSFSDSSIISSLQSMELPTVTTTSFDSVSTSSASTSIVSSTHPIPELVSSVIEETVTSSFSETKMQGDDASSIESLGHTSIRADSIQTSGINFANPPSSNSTIIEKISSLSTTSGSSSINSVTTPADKDASLFMESGPIPVSHPIPNITITTPSFISDSREMTAGSIAATGLVQKEIMIEVGALKNIPKPSDTHQNINTFVSQPSATETYTSVYEEGISSTSSSSELVSPLNIETTTLPNALIPSGATIAPSDNNLDSNIVYGGNQTAETVNNANLHDEL